jgi:predicted RNA-binding Zn ribbon-like protein
VSATKRTQPTVTIPPLDREAMPILGEPFVVEFANTAYRSGSEITDYLATGDLIHEWFAAAPAATVYVVPSSSRQLTESVRELRDAVHALCDHITARSRATPTTPTDVLNRYASRATGHFALHWTHSRLPTGHLVFDGSPHDVFLARLATDVITMFASADRARIRRCATPACELFFVQRHHLRRFCCEPCSQRTRQSRYYHSK